MATDEVIWLVINNSFCLFKVRPGKGHDFCRNEHNVTGLCNRRLCPLANAKYATVKNVEGKLYLYMKTAERAHMPAKLWERVRLLKNYAKALQQVDHHLQYWSQFMIHTCKLRLTRLTQVALTERRLALTEDERHYVGIKPKIKRREENRERKALAAARIEKAIEKELLDRLKSGAYGDQPLNVDEKIWKKVLGKVDEGQENEFDEDDDDVVLESGDEDEMGNVEYVEDDGEDELVDMEDLQRWLGSLGESSDEEDDDDDDKTDKKAPKKKRPHVEIEYEDLQTNIAA